MSSEKSSAVKSGINARELSKHVAPRNIFQPPLSCTKFVVCRAVCNTQMEIKWSWNNKKHDEHLFDDRITNHWFNYLSSSRLPNASDTTCCYLQNLLTVESSYIAEQSKRRYKWFSGTLSFIFRLIFVASIIDLGEKSGSGGKRLQKGSAFMKLNERFFLPHLSQSATTPVLVNINNICLIPSNIYHGCLPRK